MCEMNEGNPRFTQTEKVEGFRLCYLVYNNITKTLIHLSWSVLIESVQRTFKSNVPIMIEE